jgi:hypothetical protein
MTRMYARFAGCALGAVAAVAQGADASAGNPLLVPRSIEARRADGPIRLDGVLDEPAWQTAPVAGELMQSGPHPGEPAQLPTTFRVLFDDQALYVGVRLVDPEPATIEAPLGRRDDENASDWCFVEIDSRRDRRTGFSLGVNPAGTQVDGVWFDDVGYDATWNAVWEAATRVDGGGWTAEFRIPFSVLAFQPPVDGEPMRWGINIYRHNPHTGESSNWSPRMSQLAGIVSLFNELVVDAAPRVRRLELTPYGLVRFDHAGAPGMHAGLDANIGITSSVALTATVLPDFGQVEADPTQLNLTSFELFQQERRPFFTEGIDAFQFSTALPLVTRDDAFTDETAFYSRRIGRAPEGDIPVGATAPAATDILAAAKLFGRSAGWRAGVLAAATGAADASGPMGATRVAAPSEAVVGRVVREADSGDAAIGGFASGLHREVDGALARELVRGAATVGVDGSLRWDHQTYQVTGWAMATGQSGSPEAIARLAAAPWHNFGRPDAPRLRLAEDATQLTGAAGQLQLAKVGGALKGSVAARAVSPGFDVNDLGFQRNTDWALVAGQWSYESYPKTSLWLRKWVAGTDNVGVGWSLGGERRAAVADGNLQLYFTSYWDAAVTLQHEWSALSTEWLRGGPALALPPRDLAKLSIHTDVRRSTQATLDAVATREPGSHSRSARISPSATLRFSDHVAATLGASYQVQRIGWQLLAGPGAAPADTYLVGQLDQRAISLSLQTDIAISPRLIIQLYAQPFATVGRYSRYALLADPRAARPEDRFALLGTDDLTADATTLMIHGAPGWSVARPDGAQRTLIATAVARWEVRPGSFLTAVWSHRGDAATATPRARLGTELNDVLTEPGSDVALIKLGWRFAP